MFHMVTLVLPKLEVTDAFIVKMEKDLKHRGLVGVVFWEEENSYTVTIYSEYERPFVKMMAYRHYAFAGYETIFLQERLLFWGPIDTLHITGYDDSDY